MKAQLTKLRADLGGLEAQIGAGVARVEARVKSVEARAKASGAAAADLTALTGIATAARTQGTQLAQPVAAARSALASVDAQ